MAKGSMAEIVALDQDQGKRGKLPFSPCVTAEGQKGLGKICIRPLPGQIQILRESIC